MPRRPVAHKKSTSDRVRALPWAALAQAFLLIGQRWRSLSEKDRERLSRLVRDSQGRLGNLSAKERRELGKLLRKLDLRALAGELAGLARRGGGRGRRRAGA